MMNTLPISSNNNINEGNSQEEFVSDARSLLHIQKGDEKDLISKKRMNEKEPKESNQRGSQQEEIEDNEEGLQEKKDLFSCIKSTGKMINNHNISSFHSTQDGNFEVEGKWDFLWGYRTVGHGGQGKVTRLRKEHPPDLVIKYYEKSKEKEFRTEASILKDLKLNCLGGVGLKKIVVTPEEFGIVMDGGIGSLHDFRDFMIENNIQLTEEEALSLNRGILINYKAIRSIGVLHRDIKPANIILHYENFNLEIIDYGLADYDYSRSNWPGGKDTRGFTKSNLMDNEESFTSQELLKGDYFSIVTTTLFMVDLEFVPRRTKPEKEVEKSFKRISKFETLYQNLKALSEGQDLIQEEIELRLYNASLGYDSGLSKYKGHFLDYMLQKEKERNPMNQEGAIVFGNGISLLSFLDSIKFSQTKTTKDMEKWLQITSYSSRKQKKEVQDCLELFLKTFIQRKKRQDQGSYQETQPNFKKLFSIVNIVRPFIYNSLFFSTLGVHSYLINKFERARFLLRKGLEICKEDFSMLILLSNYGYLCSKQGYYQDDYATLEKIESLLKSIRNDFFENQAFIERLREIYTVDKTKLGYVFLNGKMEKKNHDETREIHKADGTNIIWISSGKRSRKDEVILSTYNFRLDFKDDEKVILLAFLLLCHSRSTLLESLLEENHRHLLLEIKQFCVYLNQGSFADISFKPSLEPSLELFMIFVQFNKILQSYQKWDSSYREIKELKGASDFFEKNKNEMKRLFKEGTSVNLFKTVLENSLFTVFLGFIIKFPEPEGEETGMKPIVSDHLKIKLDMLREKENKIEICFPSRKAFGSEALASILENLFNSDFISNPPIEDLQTLQIIDPLLTSFQYRIQYDPSSISKKFRITLIHVELFCVTSEWRSLKLPLIPKRINLESLHLFINDPRIFDEEDKTFEEILANKSLLKFSANFVRNLHSPRYYNDCWVKKFTQFVGSLKLLKDLAIKFYSAHFTEEGIHLFEEALKELPDLESLELRFETCPRVTDASIESLVETIDKSCKITSLMLKFKGCKEISLGIAQKLKNKMKPYLKEKADIQVLPI